jgi:hypothetical protein
MPDVTTLIARAGGHHAGSNIITPSKFSLPSLFFWDKKVVTMTAMICKQHNY